MENKYKMFSEEDYVTKIQLRNIYQNTAAEMIYEEVLVNRAQYRYPLSFCERHYYATMNPALIKKMTRIYESDKVSSQQENLLFDEKTTIEDWLTQYISINHISIKKELFAFLCSEEPLVLKVFVLLYLQEKESLLYHFLQFYKKEYWLPILKKIEKITIENKEALDLTYEIRNFLDIFFLQLTMKMLPLTGRGFFEGHSRESIAQLYPQLNASAIDFYFSHSIAHHHYTISHYERHCGVSYEAARQAMQKFVYLNWYQQIKVGKKYVYVPTL